jgi:Xaa-Pro aminopeptidase
MDKAKIPEIQKFIKDQRGLDGWFIFDFRKNNALGIELLNIDPSQLLSRRFFYWIPKTGTPVKIVHNIETSPLQHLPGKQITYESWQSLDAALASCLKGKKRIAMEHSPMGTIPVLANLDAGLYEWLQTQNIEVISSWNIAKHFISRWNNAQLKAHREAAKFLNETFDKSFARVQKALRDRKKITEYMLQQEIVKDFAKNDIITEHAPIVATGPNSASGHYCPTQEINTRITNDSLLLIDIWGKKNRENAPYADFTRVAYYGKKPPQEMVKIYNTVRAAQQAGIDFVEKNLKKGNEVLGCDVDDVCRKVIQKNGYGKYFVHRTGHNIHTMLHGFGPNLDNYETHDSRPLMPRTCYSVEPGIYLPNAYGIRLECNIILHDDHSVEITGRALDELPCL